MAIIEMVHDMKPKVRRRTPLLCLNCKKRKVKCDKSRPACEGCVRRLVPNKCVYQDPHWISDWGGSPDIGDGVKMKLKLQTTGTIAVQEQQIQELRRKISFLEQQNANTFAPVNVLRKLSLRNMNQHEILECSGNMYTVSNGAGVTVSIDTFNWINLVKLDSQLTSLWLQITRLQAIYKRYKASLTVQGAERPCLANGSMPASELAEINSSLTARRNSGDFSRFHENQHGLVYPVDPLPIEAVQCSSPMFPSIVSPQPMMSASLKDNLKNAMMRVWDSSLALWHILEPLNISQIHFLIEYYFNGIHHCESRDNLVFFKADILAVAVSKGGKVDLSFSSNMSFEELESKAIYGCMLAILMQLALTKLLNSNPSKRNTLTIEKFHTLFLGQETNTKHLHLEIVFDVCNVLRIITRQAYTSVAFLALQVIVLNRLVCIHKTLQDRVNTRQIFTDILSVVLSNITNGSIDLARDPELVIFKEAEQSRRNSDLKLCLCFLWVNCLRIGNLATLDFIPLVLHSANVDTLLAALAVRAGEAANSECHEKFLTGIKDANFQYLVTGICDQYLLCKLLRTTGHASLINEKPNFIIQDVCGLVNESEEWIGIQRNKHSPSKSQFETFCSISFLNYYLNYILLLHGEEIEDENVIMIAVPKIFVSLHALIEYIKKCIESRTDEYLHELTVRASIYMLSRLSQFIMGLLIRIYYQGPTLKGHTLLRDTITKYNILITDDSIPCYAIGVREYIERHLIIMMDSAVESVQSDTTKGCAKCEKLLRIWKFYLTFIDYSLRMLSIDYMKIHRDVPHFGTQSASSLDCPAMKGNGETRDDYVTMSSSRFRRCPILHITSPMVLDNRGEFIDTNTKQDSSVNLALKRSCPYSSNQENCTASKQSNIPIHVTGPIHTKSIANPSTHSEPVHPRTIGSKLEITGNFSELTPRIALPGNAESVDSESNLGAPRNPKRESVIFDPAREILCSPQMFPQDSSDIESSSEKLTGRGKGPALQTVMQPSLFAPQDTGEFLFPELSSFMEFNVDFNFLQNKAFFEQMNLIGETSFLQLDTPSIQK